MPSWEIVVFIVAALVAGGLSIGAVTLVYFLDKWREDPAQATRDAEDTNKTPRASPFDRAA
ncbi:hypothetical protein ACNKF0_09405 [Nocardioides sp. T5]|uniref:hypothetical protein n=1 Tax=Nocardioides sp. T5 TaxID=3400182 RepID=UPI003A85788F